MQFVLHLSGVNVITAAENLLQQFSWYHSLTNWRVYIRAFLFSSSSEGDFSKPTNIMCQRKIIQIDTLMCVDILKYIRVFLVEFFYETCFCSCQFCVDEKAFDKSNGM